MLGRSGGHWIVFTPELVSEAHGAFILVANHSLESAEAVQLSIEYNQARIAFGLSHLPPNLQKCRLIYDIRGQQVTEATLIHIQQTLGATCSVEFKR